MVYGIVLTTLTQNSSFGIKDRWMEWGILMIIRQTQVGRENSGWEQECFPLWDQDQVLDVEQLGGQGVRIQTISNDLLTR